MSQANSKGASHTPVLEVREVLSPSFPDLDLAEQIENGICDWVTVVDGREVAWGRTEKEARDNAMPMFIVSLGKKAMALTDEDRAALNELADAVIAKAEGR